ELGHAQQVDEMVLVVKGGVAPVFDVLLLLEQGHLRVEEAVLVDVLLVLDLLLVGELGHGLLVLAVELLHGLRVPLLGPDVLLRAAGDDSLIVGAVVSLEVALGLGNELRDLGLVLGFNLLGLFKLLLELGRALLLLFSGIDAVALEVLKAVLYVQDLV